MEKPTKFNSKEGQVIFCRLEKAPEVWNSGCEPGECKSCGWNDAVDRQRKLQIRKKGLTKDENGRRRLALKKERDKQAPE